TTVGQGISQAAGLIASALMGIHGQRQAQAQQQAQQQALIDALAGQPAEMGSLGLNPALSAPTTLVGQDPQEVGRVATAGLLQGMPRERVEQLVRAGFGPQLVETAIGQMMP